MRNFTFLVSLLVVFAACAMALRQDLEEPLNLEIVGYEISDQNVTLHLESSPMRRIEWTEGCNTPQWQESVRGMRGGTLNCPGSYPKSFSIPVVVVGNAVGGGTVYARDTVGR